MTSRLCTLAGSTRGLRYSTRSAAAMGPASVTVRRNQNTSRLFEWHHRHIPTSRAPGVSAPHRRPQQQLKLFRQTVISTPGPVVPRAQPPSEVQGGKHRNWPPGRFTGPDPGRDPRGVSARPRAVTSMSQVGALRSTVAADRAGSRERAERSESDTAEMLRD